MKNRQPGARLLGRTGEFADLTHNFGIEASLGRSAGNDVVLNSPYLSGRHARIYFKEGEYYIEDLGSRNGTRVDGVAVTAPVCLDRIHVITLADAVDLVWVRTDMVVPQPQAEPAPQPQAQPTPQPRAQPATQPRAQPPQPPAQQPPRPAVPPAPAPADRPAAGEGVPPGPDPFETRTIDEIPQPVQPPSQPPPAEPAAPSETRYDLAFSMLIDPRAAQPPTPPAPQQAPAPTPKAYDLEVTTADGKKLVYHLKPGENVLGRSDDCDVSLPDPEKWLSRRHATLTISTEGAQLKDNGTVNGTFVGGQRIDAVAIEAGTSFRLGPKLELRLKQR